MSDFYSSKSNYSETLPKPSKLYTLTLADGTKLENLRLNGTNYVSGEKIDEHVFAGNLSTLTISDGETETILRHAELIQQVYYPDANPPGWYLCFRELAPEERMRAAWEAAQKIRDVPLLLCSGVTAVPGSANTYRRSADGLVVVSVAVTSPGHTADLPEGYRPAAAVSSGDITVRPDGSVWAAGSMVGTVCFYAV